MAPYGTHRGMLHLSLRQYEYVVAVAEAGGFAEAARRVGVSQPSLSVAVGLVEARIGRPLFERRRGAGVVLLPQGRGFVERARAMLEAARALEEGRAPEGEAALTVGVLEDLAPFDLAPLLRGLRVALAETRIEGRVAGFEGLAEALRAGRADVTVTYDLGLDASFRRETLAMRSPHAFVPPGDPLAGGGPVTLARLAGRPLILFEDTLSVRHVLGLFVRAGLRPRVAHRVGGLETLRSLAAGGEGVGVSYARPPGTASYDDRPVLALPVADPGAAEPIVAATFGSSSLPPAVARSLAALRAHYGGGSEATDAGLIARTG